MQRGVGSDVYGECSLRPLRILVRWIWILMREQTLRLAKLAVSNRPVPDESCRARLRIQFKEAGRPETNLDVAVAAHFGWTGTTAVPAAGVNSSYITSRKKVENNNLQSFNSVVRELKARSPTPWMDTSSRTAALDSYTDRFREPSIGVSNRLANLSSLIEVGDGW